MFHVLGQSGIPSRKHHKSKNTPVSTSFTLFFVDETRLPSPLCNADFRHVYKQQYRLVLPAAIPANSFTCRRCATANHVLHLEYRETREREEESTRTDCKSCATDGLWTLIYHCRLSYASATPSPLFQSQFQGSEQNQMRRVSGGVVTWVNQGLPWTGGPARCLIVKWHGRRISSFPLNSYKDLQKKQR
jgi:hypothetical protein